ncbi:flagellar type III secretion system pore protein FliP [Buchnera aphidicola (Ceratoglyphina bambusae)]|uniref:flagellar type III secretion system pore protein FliP n=1 Tax=Buchnera aphidicola TaxID=9 RepID=UPI0031B852E8
MRYSKILLFFFSLFSTSVYASNLNSINNLFLNKENNFSIPLDILIIISSLSFLPALILLMTSFTRIIIVLSLLRNALGLSYAPPNQILIGLSLFITFFIMSPVFNSVYKDSYLPFVNRQINSEKAIESAILPFKKFMLNQVKDSDISFFLKLSKNKDMKFKNKYDIPLYIVVPTFITNELKISFQIGFMLFVPFIVIDLIVSSVLMALGMMMVPPSSISLPFKLIIFVLADGWHLLSRSLVESFYF